MKKGKTRIQINFSKRWIYFLITLGILIVISIGVYATVIFGNTPTNGHLLSRISPPLGCASGQFIYWNGDNLVCRTLNVAFGSHCFELSNYASSGVSVNVSVYPYFPSSSIVTDGGCDCQSSGGAYRSAAVTISGYPAWNCVCNSASGTKSAYIIACA